VAQGRDYSKTAGHAAVPGAASADFLEEAPALFVGLLPALQSGTEPQKNRAIAYTYRAIAYRAKGDNDRAIADFDGVGLPGRMVRGILSFVRDE
jgi:hypothetical protein